MTSSQIEVSAELAPKTAQVRKKTKTEASLLAYRLMILYRFALALIGGYALAYLSAVTITQVFAEQRGSAAMAATLIAFTVWTGAFIWVFMVNKTLKASLGILLPVLALFIFCTFLGN
ncbi:hypothetical protein [Acinetobacter tianfuensis]|uniref:Iron transporter n=1 Tax=Acinetobacter tianfuensis TaxID=2419603 RepID=A0A3A8ED97_9GAMM|nr:hypothetical protein [Acinetobacter tianfuensis]RKG32595.1 hypothetical protein D7V32_05225 [Acinetobacter tianfuensis]